MTLHVFLISDFSLIHDGISALFKAENQNIELIGTSTLFAQAIDDIGEMQIDVILLDIDSAPDEVSALINRLQTIVKAKILLLTRLNNIELQDMAILQGAHGVLRKDTTAGQLLSAIKKVAEGEIWLDCRALNRTDTQLKHFFIHEAGIGMSPGTLFGAEGSGFMRLNIGAPKRTVLTVIENIKRALQAE